MSNFPLLKKSPLKNIKMAEIRKALFLRSKNVSIQIIIIVII